MFGAYVSETWQSKATFRGDNSSLLFSLTPKFKIFRASGLSKNNIWLYNNRTNRGDFPLGIGFGGQLSNFRLWIDEDLTTGKVGQQDLAYQPSLGTIIDTPEEQNGKFKIDTVEVWGCGGQAAEAHQVASKQKQAQEIEKRRKVNRANFSDGWETGPDKFLMDMAGKTGAADAFMDDLAKIRQMKKQQQEKEAKEAAGQTENTSAATSTTSKKPAKKARASESASASFSDNDE